jgi:hypothetical protein
MEMFWQTGHAALARMLRGTILAPTCAPRNKNVSRLALIRRWQLIGKLAMACAILLTTFGTARAGTVATTMTLTSSQNPSTVGQSVTFTVNITGANGGTPTGNV